MLIITLEEAFKRICGIGGYVAFYDSPDVYKVLDFTIDEATATSIARLERLSDGIQTSADLVQLVRIYQHDLDADLEKILFFDNEKVREALNQRENILFHCLRHVKAATPNGH